MKSIKEKAEEYAPYTREDSWNRIKAAINAQTSFEAGANYVIECFESIFPFVAKKGIIYGKIKETVEQLKK